MTIVNQYLSQLKNLDTANKKALIVFSGIPGSGKTTVAKYLVTSFNAVHVCNDDLRTICAKQNVPYSTDLTIELLNLLIQIKNGFIILDASIDRKYDDVKEWAIKNKYKLIIISINCPLEILRQRLGTRINPEEWLRNLPGWHKDYQTFNASHTTDLQIDSSKPFDFDCIVEEVKRLV